MLNASMHYKYCVYCTYNYLAEGICGKTIYVEIPSSIRLTRREVYFEVKHLYPFLYTADISVFDYREEVYFD